MKGPTFTELYSARENIPPAIVPERLFRAALYPHVRPFARLIRLIWKRHFLADYEFVEDVGHLRSLEDFSLALGSFIEHPDNRGFLRRMFHLRLSARRMLKIVRTVFARSPRDEAWLGRNTLQPFARFPSSEPPV